MTEEANMAEIHRLAANAAEMQAELAFRPTRADIDDLAGVIENLRAELVAKDRLLQPKPTQEKAIETDIEVELEESCEPSESPPASLEPSLDATKISAEIDEMFRLDFDEDDDETDSAATEIDRAAEETKTVEEVEAVDMEVNASYVKLDDEARLQVTLSNGSLHALEEELVRAKERWAEAMDERARLAAQLARLQGKPLRRLTAAHAMALAVPLLAAALYYLLLPYIS